MSSFRTFRELLLGGERLNVNFTRKPFVANTKYQDGGKGWVIMAYSDDASLYGGAYITRVGVARELEHGYIAFRLKRDAVAAMCAAQALGILQAS